MIRTAYVQRRVLELYQKMKTIRYPVHPADVLPCMEEDCRILTYQQMAQMVHCSIQDVIQLCGSSTGATHCDAKTGQCLILYNDVGNPGRQLWTQLHEIGHINLGHLSYLGSSDPAGLAEGESRKQYAQLEDEADYFAWNFLAPLPIMREMNIQSAEETAQVYGLSHQAAGLHFTRYCRWSESHLKTSWENQILREFRRKRAT